MAATFKVLIPDGLLTHGLDALYPVALECTRAMLTDRSKRSSKDWPQLPCVVSKSLIAKYPRNPKCKSVSRVVIPICGDKGRQVKIVEGGIRVPALFKKAVIPCQFPRPVDGFIRHVELFKRNEQWFISYSYNTPCAKAIQAQGCIGVDRNSVGNIAVLADPQNGKVLHLGFNPAYTKANWRGRKKNLQRAGKRRLLARLRKKHRRRTTYENHVVSKQVVDYARKHCRAIVLEKLENVNCNGSKIRSYSERNQWSFAQPEQFIRYKARLAGVPVLDTEAAFSSQECSRCGHVHKPDGKLFWCPACFHKEHRDANSGFVLAQRGNKILNDAFGLVLSAPRSRLIGDPLSGKAIVL